VWGKAWSDHEEWGDPEHQEDYGPSAQQGHPPAIPHIITQVNLGTPHNFTTGSPIFQNIADNIYNIPIISCAFLKVFSRYEDEGWWLCFRSSSVPTVANQRNTLTQPLAPPPTCISILPPLAPQPRPRLGLTAKAKQFDKYFAPPQVPDITTALLVSLMSMLTTHLLLTHTFLYNQHPLILLLEFSALHVDAERHAVRVRALFKQLDTTHA
jgi:hypothetical protein